MKFPVENIKNIFSFLKSDDGSLQKRTIRSISWVGITSIVIYLISFAKGIILARLLTPEIFGLMSICMTVIRGVQIFTETGFGTALIHSQENFDKEKDTAFTLLVIRGFCIALFTIIIAPFIAKYYEVEVLDVVIKVIALSFIIESFGNINAIRLQKDLAFKKLSYLEQIRGVFDFVFVVGLAYYFRNIWALVIVHIASSFLQVFLSYIFIPGKPFFRLDFNIVKKLFSYGKFITGLAITLFIVMEIDNIIIGKMLGLSALGFYVLAFFLANLPATHFSKIVSRVLFPAYSTLQGNVIALRNAFLSVYKIVAIINIPFSVGLAALASEIIQVVYGDKWLPAAGALKILAIFGCIRSFTSLNGYLLNAIGKPNINFYCNLIRLIILLIVIFPLTERYGLVGASIAVTISIIIQYVLVTYAIKKIISISYFQVIETLIPPLKYSAIMFLVIMFLYVVFCVFNNIPVELNTIGHIFSDPNADFFAIFFNEFSSYKISFYETLFIVFVSVATYFLLSYKEIIMHIKKIRIMARS